MLACLVKTFPNKKEFRDLVQLTNYSDPESDFFEHMKHIQVREESIRTHFCLFSSFFTWLLHICFHSVKIHRRGRALRKLAKQLTDGNVVMSPHSLQNYIMPYAMSALLDAKMLKVLTKLQKSFKKLLIF